MGERTLRGTRLGSTSYETDRDTDLARKQFVEYECPYGHRFSVPFAEGAEPPATWECPPAQCCGKAGAKGAIARAVEGGEPDKKKVRPVRTHWDMLLERRSLDELEKVLSERLTEIRGGRAESA